MTENWSDLVRQLIWEINPQDNFHGTPYTFNKFDDSKLLTGEGFNAHGPGHYSADQFNTADGYRVRGTANKYDLPDKFTMLDKETKNFMLKNKISDYKNLLKESGYSDATKQQWKEYIKTLEDILNNPQLAEGNTYKVNVPNENFMWKEGRLLPEQSQYIQNLWKNRNIDFSKYLRRGIDLEHDLESIYSRKLDRIFQPMFEQMEYRNGLNDVTKRLFNRYMNELTLNEQIKFMERSGNKDKINEITKGIKGIRAKGATDGPINVTFSGKDIKMANTPLQKVMNRIPNQTLGKMATKMLQSPVVRVGGKILESSAIPLTVIDMLKLQGSYPYSEKEYKSILKDMGIEYNNGQFQL